MKSQPRSTDSSHRRKGENVPWDAPRVRSLRRHLGFSQEELAEEMGTRQQTISEWETGRYRPRGASARLLTIVAERAEFRYGQAEERNEK